MINQPDFEEDQIVTVHLNGANLIGRFTKDCADLSDGETLYLRPLMPDRAWYQIRWDAINALEY